MIELARRSWPALVDCSELLVVPLGATEQHGPHLPLGTDTAIATALAHRLSSRVGGIVVGPTVPYGCSGEHQDFAGTLSIGQAAMELLLVELGRSAGATFPRLLFLSGHGGNAEPLSKAVRTLRSEGRDARAWSPARHWNGDVHAGHIETSVMLSLCPTDVDLDQAVAGEMRPLADIWRQLQAGGVAAVSRNGVLGDPTTANAIDGVELLSAAADGLAAAVSTWPDHPGEWL